MTKKDCSSCNAACCKYVAMEIDVPEDLDDFENIKWYVAHENVSVFVEEDYTWNLEFVTPCIYLKDNLCSIHEDFVSNPSVSRPKICREFSVEQCPYHNDYIEKYRFSSISDVENYIKEVFEKDEHVVPTEEDSVDE